MYEYLIVTVGMLFTFGCGIKLGISIGKLKAYSDINKALDEKRGLERY